MSARGRRNAESTAPMLSFFSHHKCATRWFADYLTRVSDLNGYSLFHTDYHDQAPDRCVEIAFHGNATYSRIVEQNLSGIHLVRNPLNIVVSAYYSHLETHPVDNWPQLRRQREALKSVSREEGMLLTLAFLERMDIADRAIGPILSLRQWDYEDNRFTTLRMEDVTARPSASLSQALSQIRPDSPLVLPADSNMAFSNFSGGRKVGEADNHSHYRSGAVDSWKTELPSAVTQYFRSHFREFLARFYPDTLVDG